MTSRRGKGKVGARVYYCKVRGPYPKHALKDQTLSSAAALLTSLRLELAYFSGQVWFKRRGAGVILRFERIRSRQSGGFQPRLSNEITPGFLDRTIRALKRWNYDIVSIDEVCRRAVTLASRRRFACLTFDGIYKDVAASAYPVLAQHQVPFTVYVPTAFPDGIGEAWWLALEQVIAQERRVSLMMGRNEMHFSIPTMAAKHQLYDHLSAWMRSLEPADLSAAIRDLCTRYAVDLAALSREASLDWRDLAMLSADPRVTIGGATVNFPVLANMKDAAAFREMTMGKAVMEAALRRDARHFAYPFGDLKSWQRRHMTMAEDAGFVSAVSTVPGIIEPAGNTPLLALPRMSWDGRVRSLRALRVVLAGAGFP
jgi:peptidoglycan/xylan/chitin deacetylase (PgdA/CDA1 family)